MRTARRKVEGLGGSHHGAGVWIKERVSSIMLVILGVWGFYGVTQFIGGGYDDAIEWLHQPMNAVAMLLLMLTALYHMHLGLRVVIEDYVHTAGAKGACLLFNFAVCLGLAAISAFAVLRVAFGGDLGV
jgi:succinate dehydrogenase / fumarate reductase membrane anchor subunit